MLSKPFSSIVAAQKINNILVPSTGRRRAFGKNRFEFRLTASPHWQPKNREAREMSAPLLLEENAATHEPHEEVFRLKQDLKRVDAALRQVWFCAFLQRPLLWRKRRAQ